MKNASAEELFKEHSLVDMGVNLTKSLPGDILVFKKHVAILLRRTSESRGDIFHVHTMSQFLEDDLLTGAIERKVAEVFEPEVLSKK